MRIITGNLKGRKLFTPINNDIRPTAERVKEALFSTIQFEIENAQVLDLFCGTGQLGLEALSRGAVHCVFVDSQKASCDLALKNIVACRMDKQSRVLTQDYARFLKTTNEIFDIAFLDPPYESNYLEKVLLLLSEKMSDIGIIVFEHDALAKIPEQLNNKFIQHKQSKYGKTKITMYRKEKELE